MDTLLANLSLRELNPMQRAAHEALAGEGDVVLLSPTGSGKTVAYLLPLLKSVQASGGSTVQAVVMVPSHELAAQTCEVAARSKAGVRALAVYGGRPAMDEHRQMMRQQPQLVIGTPGRMLDHLQKGNLEAAAVRWLVIDEFDKCLELGFQQEMAAVLQYIPAAARRVLLSATDSDKIPRFIGDMRSARRLDYRDRQPAAGRISQWLVASPVKDKLTVLRTLLLTLGCQRTIVFVGYRESVERVVQFLRREGFGVVAFHGGMDQKERERNLFRFSSGSANILVSTDLASRGLDLPEVENAVHYHLPLDAQAYTHRIGRTARWDATGSSYLILGPEETWSDASSLLPWSPPAQLPTVCPPQWETLYIGRGKKDKLSRGDVAGFLMKVGGLDKADVGVIQLHDHHAFAAVTRLRLAETLVRVRGQKIKGMKTLVERINP